MPNNFDLVPVDHDPFDPTGFIGPTQQLGQPSILQAFMRWRDSGQSFADKLQAAEGDPKEQMRLLIGFAGPGGMATPHPPPGFAENLAKLVAKGLSQRDIAQELGVSRNTVIRNMPKQGLKPNPTSAESGAWSDPKNVDTLIRMHQLGASDAKIGKEIGLSPGAIWGKRTQLGLEANNPPGGYGAQKVFGLTAPSGRPPSMPKTSVTDPGEPGHPWLMQQLGYDPDFTVRPVDHDPFKK